MRSKKAQIGETMTWVVATLIIIVILIISIYAAFLLAQTRKKIFVETEREDDLLMEKSLFAYFLADDTKKNIILNKLKQQEFHADLDAKLDEIRSVLG
ncbi:MAG TPA: hypothetical protein ENI22_00960 [Candidatus Pacearchaeota archaeon]|nr:hypothetical protein [Candidatus Pacearchaeota archaeon]